MMFIGAQLYTVRDHMQDLNGISESLKRTADIGYKYVQVSGACDHEAEWLKEELDKNGLVCVLTHYDREKIASDPEEMIKRHQIIGCSRIGIGWFNVHETGAVAFYEKYKDAAEKIKNAGMKLYYHNHDHEFTKSGNGTLLDDMLALFPADMLGITLDTYWVQAGGGDPAAWIRKLAGRTDCIHYKDMAYDRKMMAIGKGNMNFDAIIKASVDAKIQYALVEQDNCNGEDPFDCLKQSYDYLTAQGLRAR